MLVVVLLLLYGCAPKDVNNEELVKDNTVNNNVNNSAVGQAESTIKLADSNNLDAKTNWEWLIQPGEFEEVKLINSNLIAVKNQSGSFGIIDRKKDIIADFEYFNVFGNEDSILVLDNDKKFSILDCNGNLVTKEKYDGAELFYEGLAAVKKDNKWGFINYDGELVIDYEYDGVKKGFSNGLAAVEKGGRWQFIDVNGESAFDMDFENVHPFQEGLAAVMENDSWGFIDLTGAGIIENQYDEVGNFSEGLATVCKESDGLRLWAYIDKNGDICIDFSLYDAIEGIPFIMGEFHNDYAVITDSVHYLIDREGKKVLGEDSHFIAGGFDYNKELGMIPAYDYEDEKMIIEKYGFIDINGNEVIPLVFYNVSDVQGDLASIASKDDMVTNGVIILRANTIMNGSVQKLP